MTDVEIFHPDTKENDNIKEYLKKNIIYVSNRLSEDQNLSWHNFIMSNEEYYCDTTNNAPERHDCFKIKIN